MTDFVFGAGKHKRPKNVLQSEKSTAEERKRFILKCASGGFARGGPSSNKVTLPTLSFMKDK